MILSGKAGPASSLPGARAPRGVRLGLASRGGAGWRPALLWGSALFAFLSAAVALEPVTARSTSGQFTVRGLPLGPPMARRSTSEVSYLRLDPTLTAVSLERIRQALGSELALPEGWRGPIHVATFPVLEDHPEVTVTSVKFANGWGYRVEMPEVLDKPRFIRTGVSVVLLEFANRTALTREAELPPWLAEGLAAELESTALATLALEPGAGVSSSAPRADPLRRAREIVRERGTLTFNQLSLPGEPGVEREHYAACAHLFVHELLRLRDGPDNLRAMLAQLPRHLNWQTAFLGAFQARFRRLIDVDKWYLLAATHVAGRDGASQWPAAEAATRLDEVLSTAVEVRTDAQALPITTAVRLQRLIGEWALARQLPVLEGKVSQLELLLPRSPPDAALLAAGYRQILQAYLRQRIRPAAPTKIQPATDPRLIVHETLRKLNELDRKFEAWRGQLPSGGGVAGPAPKAGSAGFAPRP